LPTELLYLNDSYLRRFDATVVRADPRGVVLDRTAFYPGGGGQPPDSGYLIAGGERLPVEGASMDGDEVLHAVRGPAPPAGAHVVGELDWGRRYAHMRLHTAVSYPAMKGGASRFTAPPCP